MNFLYNNPSEKDWTPSDDFSENYKPIGFGGKNVLVYEHVSLYEITIFDKSGNGGYKAIIKNKEEKNAKNSPRLNNG
jgi:hypothetical protein